MTDGFVPPEVVTLFAESEKETKALLDAVLLEKMEEGYMVHDYLDYNPSAAELKSLTMTRAMAGKKGGRKTQASAKAKAKQKPSKNQAKGMGMGMGSKKKKRAPKNDAQLPPDWAPSDSHRAYAKTHGVDLESSVSSFRLYFEGEERASWNKSFATWLGNRVIWRKPGEVKPPGEADHEQRSAKLTAEAKELRRGQRLADERERKRAEGERHHNAGRAQCLLAAIGTGGQTATVEDDEKVQP